MSKRKLTPPTVYTETPMNPKTIAALGRNQWQILSEVRSGNNRPFDLEMYTLITAYQQVADALSSEERGDYSKAFMLVRRNHSACVGCALTESVAGKPDCNACAVKRHIVGTKTVPAHTYPCVEYKESPHYEWRDLIRRGDYVNAAQYARQMRDIFADFIQLQE